MRQSVLIVALTLSCFFKVSANSMTSLFKGSYWASDATFCSPLSSQIIMVYRSHTSIKLKWTEIASIIFWMLLVSSVIAAFHVPRLELESISQVHKYSKVITVNEPISAW